MKGALNFAGAFRRGKKYPETLLDIGCGLCREGEELLARGIALTGIDQDGETIRSVQKRLPAGHFIAADAAAWLAGTDRRYDAVLIRRPDLIFRSANWHAVFQRIPYVLKEGGRVIVTTPGRSEAGLAAKWLRESADPVDLMETGEPEEGFWVRAENWKAEPQKKNERSSLIQDLAWEDDAPQRICDLRTGLCTGITDQEETENENRNTGKESDEA